MIFEYKYTSRKLKVFMKTDGCLQCSKQRIKRHLIQSTSCRPIPLIPRLISSPLRHPRF